MKIEPVAWRYQDEELFGDGQCRYLDLPPIRQYKRVEALYSQSAIDTLRAEAESLRKDAERYRWVFVSPHANDGGAHFVYRGRYGLSSSKDKAQMDAYIDAATQASE